MFELGFDGVHLLLQASNVTLEIDLQVGDVVLRSGEAFLDELGDVVDCTRAVELRSCARGSMKSALKWQRDVVAG